MPSDQTRALLDLGKVSLERCGGVFEDGTPFEVPVDLPHPAPLDLAAQAPGKRRDALGALAHEALGVAVLLLEMLRPQEHAKVSLERCGGVFEDGTPFEVPVDLPHPAPLDLAVGLTAG
jgi:predicted component of type VI protein secretion system